MFIQFQIRNYMKFPHERAKRKELDKSNVPVFGASVALSLWMKVHGSVPANIPVCLKQQRRTEHQRVLL